VTVPKTQLVLFDVGSTLVDPFPSSREIVLRVLLDGGMRLDLSDLQQAEPQAWQSVSHLLPFQRYGRAESQVFWNAFYSALLDCLGIAHDQHIRGKIYHEFQRVENWRCYPDCLPALNELKAAGYRLGVVSNWEEWLDTLLVALGLSELFEVAIAFGNFGRAKPDPSIFYEALRVVGVSPDRAVYVGDSLRDDVEGARAAGLRPILIDRQTRFPLADVERISSLTELMSLLE